MLLILVRTLGLESGINFVLWIIAIVHEIFVVRGSKQDRRKAIPNFPQSTHMTVYGHDWIGLS